MTPYILVYDPLFFFQKIYDPQYIWDPPIPKEMIAPQKEWEGQIQDLKEDQLHMAETRGQVIQKTKHRLLKA